MIDIRSDTVTKPTSAMRRAMANAEVGDDVLDGDPTVRRLEARVAEMLGKQSALFFPTGTMANQASLCALGRAGTELVLDAASHMLHLEMGGAAMFAGLQVRPVGGAGGVMDEASLRASFRAPSQSYPRQSVLALENTHNGGGGKVTPMPALRALAAVARERDMAVHLDGARLWNASATTGTALADFAAVADTVMVSFAKGLGAPVGAALACSRELQPLVYEARKRLGGGMRQSGVLAAACLHGLDHHLARIGEDHERAAEYAAIVDGAGGARVVQPDTNIVMLDLPTPSAAAIAAQAKEQGVLVSVWGPSRIRAVMHLDVDRPQVSRAAHIVAACLVA
ncbi:MAG: threonine aldolase family protein [Gemmatimonadaceae bacterium]